MTIARTTMSAESAVLPTRTALQDRLKTWARAHRVRWEMTRHFEIVHDRKTQVGFDLTLSAPRPAGCDGDPGCLECARTHEEMGRIAVSLLPPGTQYDVEPFDGSFHLGDCDEPELLLTVEILADAREPELADCSGRRTLALVEAGLRCLEIRQKSTAPVRSGR